MSERKGMKQYPEWVKEQVRERIAAGETQKQLSKELGISRYSIQSWCGLRPETKLWQLAPMPKGRPKKNKTIEDYEKENKRLRMEVALMRDFLQSDRKDVRPKVKYAVINRHRNEYAVSVMCKFFEVSRSGYYDFVQSDWEGRERCRAGKENTGVSGPDR